MADVAGVRDLESICLCRSDKIESVGTHVYVFNCLFDFRHVASDTFAAGAVGLVMCVRFDRSGVWPVRRIGSVAV